MRGAHPSGAPKIPAKLDEPNPPGRIEIPTLDHHAVDRLTLIQRRGGRPLKNVSTVRPDFGERSFGSSLDPLLTGVAQGLAQLFPPVENPRRRDDADGAGRSREDERDRDEE